VEITPADGSGASENIIDDFAVTAWLRMRPWPVNPIDFGTGNPGLKLSGGAGHRVVTST
jgi:hypothetical protein